MPISMPGANQPDVIYTITLEGQGYDIRFRWNNRSDSWFMYVGFLGTTPSMKTRVVTNRDLLASYRGRLGIPPGSIYVVDIEKGFGRPSFDNLGINRRFEVLYFRTGEDNPFES